MGVAIAHYTAELEPAVHAFNRRLEAGGIGFRFPAPPAPAPAEAPLARHAFVAVENGTTVRGGYLLEEQDVWLRGRRARIGYLHLPLSEGLIERRFSAVGAQLLVHALKRQPRLFGLGIGSRDEAFARMIAALGWPVAEVPFFFRVVRPFRVSRGLRYARRTRGRGLALDLAAWSGAAWVGARLVHGRMPVLDDRTYRLEPVDSFTGWADAVWERCHGEYALIARRDEAALELRYPPHASRYLRLRLRRRGAPVGWAVVLDTPMRGHRYFGDLRVGTIVDWIGDAAHAVPLAAAVTRHLASRPVDLIVTNQTARHWQAALRAAGFRRGPSNYLFAASPRLAGELAPWPDCLATVHLTRGDGDGPINL